MKIDLNSPATEMLSTGWSTQKASKTNESASQAAAGDRVTLASAGATVQSLTAQAMNTPQVRQDKVDSLRQSISSGSYQLDPAQIASAISAGESD